MHQRTQSINGPENFEGSKDAENPEQRRTEEHNGSENAKNLEDREDRVGVKNRENVKNTRMLPPGPAPVKPLARLKHRMRRAALCACVQTSHLERELILSFGTRPVFAGGALLNGWQRLWVVIAALWALPVLVVAWSSWPTNANLSEAEISASLDDVPDAAIRVQLPPAVNATLTRSSPTEFWVAKVGGKIVNPYSQPDPAGNIFSDPGWLQAVRSPTTPSWSVHKFADVMKKEDPQYGNLDEDVVTADVLRKSPEYRVLVDPSAIAAASRKFEDLIAVQSRVSTIARTIAIRNRVHAKRTRMAMIAVALWTSSVAVLYALGWSVGWVRRGFSPADPPARPADVTEVPK